MVKGDAVKSFTMMFLQMWDAASPKSKNEENYEQYLVPADYKLPEGYAGNGFVMPYADSPLDEEQVGEQVYLDILNQAKSYVHIITPYLILDDEMKNAMAYADKARDRCEDHHAPYSGQKVCVSVSKNLLSRTDRFRSEDLRIRAWLYPCQDTLSAMMKKQLWEASTWISEACICILSVEPIYTETAQLQMWRRILRKRWKNAFQLH